MSECNHQCGGRCCQNFVINLKPEDIGRQYLDARARAAAGVPYETDRDIIFIAEMVIRIDEDDETYARYTCRHFVEATGLCGAYNERPRMCRDYPYGRLCEHGCGYKNELPELVQISPNTDETKPDERAA